MRREPGNGLIFGGSRLRCDIRDLEVSTHRESMARLLIHTEFALVRLWEGRHDCLDLLGLLKRDLVVILRACKGHWALDLFHVRGETEKARVAGEAGVDERLAVDFGAVGKRDCVLAAPAEAGRADGQRLALFLAQLLEEAFYAGVCPPRGAADEEGHSGQDGLDGGDAARCVSGMVT